MNEENVRNIFENHAHDDKQNSTKRYFLNTKEYSDLEKESTFTFLNFY